MRSIDQGISRATLLRKLHCAPKSYIAIVSIVEPGVDRFLSQIKLSIVWIELTDSIAGEIHEVEFRGDRMKTTENLTTVSVTSGGCFAPQAKGRRLYVAGAAGGDGHSCRADGRRDAAADGIFWQGQNPIGSVADREHRYGARALLHGEWRLSERKCWAEGIGRAPSEAPRWNGPYLKKAKNLLDPWGRPYQYAYPASNGEYEVYSLGPTGKANSRRQPSHRSSKCGKLGGRESIVCQTAVAALSKKKGRQ